MFRLVLSGLTFALLLGSTQPIYAQETPRAIIEKAIKAHGGEERLLKIKAAQVENKGTIFMPGMEIPYTGTTLIQLPNQFRNTMRFKLGGVEKTTTQIMNGDQAWLSVDGKTIEPPAPLLKEMKEMMHMEQVVRLTPLLKDKDFQMEALADGKVGDVAVNGVKVKMKGFRDISLYFDKSTGLLRKTGHTVVEQDMKEQPQEEIYSAYKEVDKVQRPTKVEVLRAGKKTMEGELTSIKYPDKIDAKEFAKP